MFQRIRTTIKSHAQKSVTSSTGITQEWISQQQTTLDECHTLAAEYRAIMAESDRVRSHCRETDDRNLRYRQALLEQEWLNDHTETQAFITSCWATSRNSR